MISFTERKWSPIEEQLTFLYSHGELLLKPSFLISPRQHQHICTESAHREEKDEEMSSRVEPGASRAGTDPGMEELRKPRTVCSDGGCAAQEKSVNPTQSGQVKKLFVGQRDVTGLSCQVTGSDLS